MTSTQFHRIARALADPRRLEIFQLVASQDECGCQQLGRRFPVTGATISHHLKELAAAGLVRSRREGQHVFYEAQRSTLAEYVAELGRRFPGTTSPAPRRGARTAP
jgi:ArsR family transcriptional regulator